MKKYVNFQTAFRLALGALLGLVIACQKGGGRLNAQKPQETTKPAVVEEELIPTLEYDHSDEPIIKNGVTYQAPPKKIKNKNNTELLVGRVKMEKSKISYDPATRQMKISGFARILNETKDAEIGASDFDISGSHDVDENRVLLKDPKIPKANSLEKPLVRAKATCLSIDANDHYDCSRAVIDFFIAYRKQVFTEQMELAQKTKAPTQPPQDKTPTPPTAADDEEEDLQSEGVEESIEGRYQGQAETADLTVVFDGDKGTPVIIQNGDTPTEDKEPTTPAGPVVTPTTPIIMTTQTPTSTPAKPPTAKPPATTPTTPDETQASPNVAVDSDKKEKQLSKDLQQLKNGDIRQINQAVGFPDQGRLRNSTSIYTKQQALNENAFFEVVSPSRNRHYGTYDMAEIISRMGKNLVDIHNHKLFVGNISQKAGGTLPPHASHQIGIDADIGYPTMSDAVKFPVVVQMKNRQYNPSSYSAEKTYQLLKFAFSQPDIKIDRIFMDKTIKKSLCDYAKSKNEFNSKDKALVNTIFNSIDHVDGHGDHFHIRLRCSSYDPACRNKLYSVNKGCG